MRIKIDKLDTLFSKYIRLRAGGKCDFCGRVFHDKIKENGDVYPAWKSLQVSHFHGRRKRSLRYDPDNAIGACADCHFFLGENPYVHTEFFRKRLGSERFEQLNIRAEIIAKPDKKAIEASLKERIKLLEV